MSLDCTGRGLRDTENLTLTLRPRGARAAGLHTASPPSRPRSGLRSSPHPPGATSRQGLTFLGPPSLDGIPGSIDTSPPARCSHLHLEDVAVSNMGPSARVEVVLSSAQTPFVKHLAGVAGRPV